MKLAFMRKNEIIITIPIFTIAFIMLLLYEIFNFYNSSYQANSIIFLRIFFAIIFCVFVINRLLAKREYKTYFVVGISLLAGILALYNLPIFFFRYYEAGIYGFDDFSQFRFLYRPLGFLSNDWVTIMLCFLPFPVIGIALFWKKPLIRYSFLLIIGLLIFNLLISFSRAGILAFFLFVLLLNLLFYFYGIVSIKKLLLFNIILMTAMLLFSLVFASSIRSSINQSNSHQRSTEGRLSQWKQSMTVVRKYPMIGIGSKNYALLGRQPQQTNLENRFPGRVNNTYIQLAIEKGIIGLLLWLGVASVCVFYLFRQLKNETCSLEKTINIVVLSAIFAILFREMFFSSLFYKTDILLMFLVLLTFNQKYSYKPIKVRKSIIFAFIVLFASGTFYFYSLNPECALSYANRGLEYERNGDFENAIQYYKKACQLNSNDALFWHNLGWLYYMTRQPDSAQYYLTQAVATDPEVTIYHVSKGLIIEDEDLVKSFESYKQAILLSPDIIDSKFFKELRGRHSFEVENLLKDVYHELLRVNSVRYSSVIDAKIGKLQLSIGETELAYEILTHVTRIHPNLSRPWFYLGFIEQKRGNYENMLSYYKKSLFLLPSDHLPLYALASYYREIGDEQIANSYYKTAERVWKNKRSVHSLRSKGIYFMDTERDNIVPDRFLDYITPNFETFY